MYRQQRFLAIHDISCFGKCSLTVALPILSAAGHECTILPTAVLSTHTGGFTGFTLRDLSEDLVPIAEHWQNEQIRFDAIYTGYICSKEQIATVSRIIEMQKDAPCRLYVDPVMGDNGKLYALFPEDFPDAMAGLCRHAYLIMPNITEACAMLHRPFLEPPYTEADIQDLMRALTTLGPRKIVLTGVTFEETKLGAASYDADLNEFHYAFSDRIDGYYHGTGDVFGSALVSAVQHGIDLCGAIRIAVDFTVGAIRRTYDAKTDVRFGVDFENGLSGLAAQIHNAKTSKENEQ